MKTHFGYDAFLPLQEDIIASVMAGRDTFALMPTGGGKSLCYQLPALAHPAMKSLISLQKPIALRHDTVGGKIENVGKQDPNQCGCLGQLDEWFLCTLLLEAFGL